MKKQIKALSMLLSLLSVGGLMACSGSQNLTDGFEELSWVQEGQEDQEDSPQDQLSKCEVRLSLCRPENKTETAEEQTKTVVSKEVPEAYQIEGFDLILQMPELPTGCEITAMTMALQYYGLEADKLTMATEYLPSVPLSLQYGSDGLLYGPDLNRYFVGDPETSGGYICGTSAVVTAANQYLQDVGSLLKAVDKTGSSPEELYSLVSQDTPVVVWVTISMAERTVSGGWYLENGEYVDWASNDHGAVLIGYTQDSVTIADPISGLVAYSREAFETVFESRGRQCVILES